MSQNKGRSEDYNYYYLYLFIIHPFQNMNGFGSTGSAPPSVPMMSPAGSQQGVPMRGGPVNPEEKQYLAKLKELQKYIDPLKLMIRRTENDDGEKR